METPHYPTNSSSTPSGSAQQKLRLSLDLRWLCLLLLAVIIGMLLVWRPWQQTGSAAERTVSVTGDATIKATPDQFSFYPTYQFNDADKDAAIKAGTAKQNEIVAKLKSLGVDSKQIKTDLNGYDTYPKPIVSEPERPGGQQDGYTYNLQVTVSVPTSAQAQKVQDYLATTSPQGAVTPNAGFSDATRKKLESQARDQATKAARSKADQSAKNLGFKVGGVESVDDGSGFGGSIRPMRDDASTMAETAPAEPRLMLQPGENELSYSVSVVYYIK